MSYDLLVQMAYCPIVKEQFINSCPKNLAIHLRERAPETLARIAKIANQYLEAHGKHFVESCQ